MTQNPDIDFKKNIADLTKIPPNEFEKYFQDWMERDDVARSLQAKLRCDLITNFNKTNLGKHILAHTATSMGGSNMRLTLSPLVLALNTLVAEFLYAQNCHFTLSVFCTEIPYRNTLPDFESMRQFRFNDVEILEIWEAVTGRKAIKKDLHKHVILNYEANPNMSLLLLFIKYLLRKDPSEQLSRNAEVQTELQEKFHKSTLIQVNEQETQVSHKDENIRHLNRYLKTLSEKLREMTKEFEEFAKPKQHESRPRTLKSSRSREYYLLNKSLERITEHMKIKAQAKRKNKRLNHIVESIEGLTKEFGKCAQNFDSVTKMLISTKEDKAKPIKVKFKEKQTETDLEVKSYAEWIHEMRHSENGKKFLNRVEISLRKALTKHRQQLETESEIKLQHLKGLMKLHYQQKLSKQLLQNPQINLEETRKYNDIIEEKLQQFELKQRELLQKLEKSSIALRNAQRQQTQDFIQKDRSVGDNLEHEKYLESDIRLESEHIILQTEQQEQIAPEIEEKDYSSYLKNDQISVRSSLSQPENDIFVPTHQIEVEAQALTKTIRNEKKSNDLSKPLLEDAQQQFLDMAKTVAQHGRTVDNIICDAKLRIQQLENESNQLEQNFQSYLERRKQNEALNSNSQYLKKISSNANESQSTMSSLGKEISVLAVSYERQLYQPKSRSIENEMDEANDEEFRRMKENLRIDQEHTNVPRSDKSDSSTSSLEIRNAILEAKLKFFEHEHTIRQSKEQGDQIRSGNLLQKQLEQYTELNQISDYFNQNFGNRKSETVLDLSVFRDAKERDTLNVESSCSDVNPKDQILTEEYEIETSASLENKISTEGAENLTTSARRELFLQNEQTIRDKPRFVEVTSGELDGNQRVRYYEPIVMQGTDLKTVLKSTPEQKRPSAQVENTSELIKQSMLKMQQLFVQQGQSKETLRELVNEVEQERNAKKEDSQNKTKLEVLNKSLSTTLTSTVTNTTSTSHSSEIDTETEYPAKLNENTGKFKQTRNTVMSSILNLASESEESLPDSSNREMEITADTVIDVEEHKDTNKEAIESSDSNLLTNDGEKLSQFIKDKPPEDIGQLDSAKLLDLNLSEPDNDKEIGEIFSASHRTFATTETKLSESISSHSSTDLEISTGKQRKNHGKESDDSESDFWA